jgi:MoxR-like ATPase
MARATALMRGGEYVIPEDVLAVIDDVWRHRIHLNARARAEGADVAEVIMEITERIHAV